MLNIVSDFTFDIIEDSQQCASSDDENNPFPYVWRWRKHENVGEPLSAISGLWEVSFRSFRRNEAEFELYYTNKRKDKSYFRLFILANVATCMLIKIFGSHSVLLVFCRFDRERSSDEVLFFDCFCSIASKIEVSFSENYLAHKSN